MITPILSMFTLMCQLLILGYNVAIYRRQSDLRANDQRLYEELRDLRARVAELERL